MNKSGFTLVELMVAVVILSTGLLLIIEGMGRSERALRTAENLIIASQIAEKRAAEMEIEVRQVHELSTGTDDGKEVLPGKQFDWTVTTDSFKHATIEDETKLNRVQVAVQWNEGSRQSNLTLGTLVLNREKEV
jgi:type II secretion system protein I